MLSLAKGLGGSIEALDLRGLPRVPDEAWTALLGALARPRALRLGGARRFGDGAARSLFELKQLWGHRRHDAFASLECYELGGQGGGAGGGAGGSGRRNGDAAGDGTDGAAPSAGVSDLALTWAAAACPRLKRLGARNLPNVGAAVALAEVERRSSGSRGG